MQLSGDKQMGSKKTYLQGQTIWDTNVIYAIPLSLAKVTYIYTEIPCIYENKRCTLERHMWQMQVSDDKEIGSKKTYFQGQTIWNTNMIYAIPLSFAKVTYMYT